MEPQVQKEGHKRGRPRLTEREVGDQYDTDINLPFSLSVLEGLVAAYKFQHIDDDMILWIKDKMISYLKLADINNIIIKTAIKDNLNKFSDDAYIVEKVQEFSSVGDKMYVLVDWLGFPSSKRKSENFVDIDVLDEDNVHQVLENQKLLNQFQVQVRKLSQSALRNLQEHFSSISGALTKRLFNTVLEADPQVIQYLFNTFKLLKFPSM